MSQLNFLIGRGHLLTSEIKLPRGGGPKFEPYTFAESVKKLTPQLELASQSFDSLPDAACPEDFAVAKLALNPGFIAKSFFPSHLLRSNGFESLGSRTVKLTPEKWSKKEAPRECTTTELFIAGKREEFRQLTNWLEIVDPNSYEAKDVAHIERFSAFTPQERNKVTPNSKIRFFEVALHLIPEGNVQIQQRNFEVYVKSMDCKIHSEMGFRAGNLWFVPLEGSSKAIEEVVKYVFVRVVRPMPMIRGMRPAIRSGGITINAQLPAAQPLSSEPRVAILDGGLPKNHPIGPWVKAYHQLDSSAKDDLDGVEHGLAVTSAFLFGSVTPNGVAERPYSYVDHLRVLDKESESEDPLELYRTLGFVEQVLLSRQYEFINLSLGPDLPIEDTEVHVWTSVIDDLLSDGDTFMTIAIGNNGELDWQSGNARVQVPSDCVNAIAVGAASDVDITWARSSYSATGPGRSPGVVKPDLMAFGGDANKNKYFHVFTSSKKPVLTPILGTSFAAPNLLRSAVGIRAIMGNELSPLALKALLVHSADALTHSKHEVGWGKIPEDLLEIITCPAGVARIVYQGELKPGKYLRATLPMPAGGLTGNITLKATFCYASPIDPQDAAAYTRAGLEIFFRPNSDKIKDGKANADTAGFFDMKKYATEDERRSDQGKWETVLHGSKKMRGSSLNEPVFDIHYNAREGGSSTTTAEKIRYALIITVEAPKHADLYNDILRAYARILTPIQPQVSLPIRL